MGGTGYNNGTIDINEWAGADIVSPVAINNGAWHHVVVTYAGGGFNTTNVKIYVDGAQTTATGGAGNALNTNNGFYGIGAYAGGDYFNLVGSLDEVGVWNRALTAGEVSQLYNTGAGLAYSGFGGGGTASSTTGTTIRQQQQGNLVYADSNAPMPQGAASLALTTANQTHWSANYFSIPPLSSNPGTTYTTSYAYDANGNLTGTTMGATSTTYTWDYNNRMLTSAGTNLPSLSYVYDPSGARLSQTGATSTTIYPSRYYSLTYSGSNATSTEYVYAGDTLIATIDQAYTNGTAVGSSTVRFVHVDNLGSTQATTDMSGSLVQSMAYSPYGAVLAQANANLKRGYIGQFSDSSGLDYLNARYYSSDRGEFISEDPVFWGKQNLSDPQSMNSYSYANGNPVNRSDPSGLLSDKSAVNITRNLIADLFSLANNLAAYVNTLAHNPSQGVQAARQAATTMVTNPGGVVRGAVAGAYNDAVKTASLINSGNDADQERGITNYIEFAGSVIGGAVAGGAGAMDGSASGGMKVMDIIKGFNHDGSYHGLDQVVSRGVTPQMLKETITNPLKTVIQGDGRTRYVSSQAVVVVDPSGQVVTAYSQADFNQKTINLIQSTQR